MVSMGILWFLVASCFLIPARHRVRAQGFFWFHVLLGMGCGTSARHRV